MSSRTMPMFPLGGVLFPSLFLPLHVFEPRYRELTKHCLEADREFGVVLIERGSEVGGNDVRTNVGTVARIIEAIEQPDGRWVLGTVGTRRIRVERWLPDDPYPIADVDDWPDDDTGDIDLYDEVRTTLRRVLALAAELGETGMDATVELADDPGLGSFQVSAVAPITSLDQQSLLETPGVAARLTKLSTLLGEEEAFLRARLEMGAD